MSYVEVGDAFGVPDKNDEFLTRKQREEKYKNQFKPEWQQDVRDDKGRRRFHGAFTGGYSAGYFNSVGTKEGWAPTAFVSSRDKRASNVQRPEDFMDEEDLQGMGLGDKMVAGEEFQNEEAPAKDLLLKNSIIPGPVPQEFVVNSKAPIGKKLLRLMGWREGHGIGPRKKRKFSDDPYASQYGDAPEDVPITNYEFKDDSHGLGYDPFKGKQEFKQRQPSTRKERREELHDRRGRVNGLFSLNHEKENGFGVGVYDDDEEDAEVYGGPDLSMYDTSIGPSSKELEHRQKLTETASDTFSKPEYDVYGRKVLPGYKPASHTPPKPPVYPPPQVPAGFESKHVFTEPGPGLPDTVLYSVAAQMPDYMRAQLLNEKKNGPLSSRDRSQMLGEKLLPTKSNPTESKDSAEIVYPRQQSQAQTPPEPKVPSQFGALVDLLAPQDRSRLEQITGKKIDPPSQSTSTPTPSLSAPPPEEKSKESATFDDPVKEERYQLWINRQRGQITQAQWYDGLHNAQIEEEAAEFAGHWGLFQQPKGLLGRRFVASSIQLGDRNTKEEAEAKERQENPQLSAANMNMYGMLTRTTEDWYPESLLCKRFNIANPYKGGKERYDPHQDDEAVSNLQMQRRAFEAEMTKLKEEQKQSKLKQTLSDTMKSAEQQYSAQSTPSNDLPSSSQSNPTFAQGNEVDDDAPLPQEEEKPSMDLFKAIFLASEDSSSEEESDEDSQEDHLENNERKEASIVPEQESHPLRSRFQAMSSSASSAPADAPMPTTEPELPEPSIPDGLVDTVPLPFYQVIPKKDADHKKSKSKKKRKRRERDQDVYSSGRSRKSKRRKRKHDISDSSDSDEDSSLSSSSSYSSSHHRKRKSHHHSRRKKKDRMDRKRHRRSRSSSRTRHSHKDRDREGDSEDGRKRKRSRRR